MTDEAAPRAMHDIGGVSRYLCEPVDKEPHELTDFDREVDAIRRHPRREAGDVGG